MRSQPTCVITRVELRPEWLAPVRLLQFVLAYRRIRRAPALIAATFLVESWRSFVTFSIWSDPQAIMHAATDGHVLSVRRAHRYAAHLWSSQWHLTRLSPSAHEWPIGGVDWQEIGARCGAYQGLPSPFTWCTGQIVAACDVTELLATGSVKPPC